MPTSKEILAGFAKHQQAKAHPSRSLFEQVRDAATGVVPGLAHLVISGVEQAAEAPVRMGWRLAHGDVGGAVRSEISQISQGAAPSVLSHFGVGGFTPEEAHRLAPASTQQVESFGRTAGDVIHPSRFGKAVAEGQIVGKVLEDAANLSIAGSVAAEPLRVAAETAGSAGLARAADLAATGAETVAHLGGKIGDLPIAPARWAGRRLLGVAADRLEAAGPEALQAHGRYVDPIRRSVSRLVRSSIPLREGAAASAMADVARNTVAAEKVLPGAGEDLFTAARARVMGVDLPIRQAVELNSHLPEADQAAGIEQARRAVTGHDIEGHTVTPAAAQILADDAAGRLAPEVKATLDDLVGKMAATEQARRVRLEQGYGYSKPGTSLDPANRGTAPINPDIARLERQRAGLDRSTGRQVERAQRRVNRAEGAVRVPEGFTARDVERTILDPARLRRAAMPAETVPANVAEQTMGPYVDPRSVGVTARPESLLRGVTRTARAQGEALGVAREADLVAGRGERAPSTTRLTAEDLAAARQNRLLRRTQVGAGAPDEALAPRLPGEGLLASAEPGARQFGAAVSREADTRAAVRTARENVGTALREMDVNPAGVKESARAVRDSQVAELRSQADAVESHIRQIVDQTGPLDMRQGVGGAETRGASDQLGRRRLVVTRYGQRLGLFATGGVQGRPVGMDVAAGIGETTGLGYLNPDELASHVFEQVEKLMDMRGEANRIAKAAPAAEIGQQILSEMDSLGRQQAFGKAAAAFETDSAASIATQGRTGYDSLRGDPGARAAYQWLEAERVRAAAGARAGRAGAALDTGTARVYGRGVAEGQRLGRGETLRAEGQRLGVAADRLVGKARAVGDLPEEMAQAQARQAGTSFTAGQTAERRLAAARTARGQLDSATAQRDVALQSVDAKIAHAVADPASYPARWRPAMEANTRWADHLRTSAADAGMDPVSATMLARMADEVPLLPKDIAAAGASPEHVQFGEVRPGARQTAVSAGGIGPLRKTAAEYERSGDVAPMSPKNVAIVQGGEARRAASNETIKTLISPQMIDAEGKPVFDPVTNDPVGGYSRTLRSVLDDNTLHDIFDRVEQRVTAERVTDRPAAIRQRLGQELTVEMHQRGFEPWDPNADSLLADPSHVNERTPFLPSGTADMVRKYWAPAQRNALLSASTYLNSRWKGLVLPFSPRWQVGDIFGNYLMATEALGVDPLTLTGRMKQAAAMLRADTLPAGLGEVGLAFSDAERLGLAERTPARTPVGRAFRGIQERSFHFNSFSNGVQRGAAYLELLDRNMKAGMPVDQATATAVSDANRAMGDFAAMTPFERRFVQQVFPFYSWMRHITQLTGRLLIDHPERMVWTLHLGATYGGQEGLPDFAKGGLPIGDNFVLPLTFANPFADVTGGAALPITPSGRLGLANVGRSLSPVIKTVLAGGFGLNPARETWEATRAGGKGTDQYGRQIFEPLLGHPLELAGYAARQVPLFRVLQDVGPATDVAGYEGGPTLRYDTGQTRLRRGKPMPTEGLVNGKGGSRLNTLGAQFLPLFPQFVDPAQSAAIASARRRAGG